MKQIIISVAGSDGKREFKDVQILPGTKPRDVLAQLNLNGFQLSKPEGGAFDFNDDLYQAVSDGQKVFATKADVEAGDSGLIRRPNSFVELVLGVIKVRNPSFA